MPPDTRLVMEKPFGSDTASADKLNQVLTRLVPEDQIYRVDHYLGMSTVLNIFGFRYTNRVLESVLDSSHVASVDILLDERLALEGRAGYYDNAGALVDMLQSRALHVCPFWQWSRRAPSATGRTRRRSRGVAGHPGVGKRPGR